MALLVLWCLTFAPQLSGRSTFVRGDAGQFTAFSEFSHAEWRQFHRRTFWNPYVFLGLPAVASLADGRPQWLPGPNPHRSTRAPRRASSWHSSSSGA